MSRYVKPKSEELFKVTADDIVLVVPKLDREEVRRTLDAITEEEVNEFRMRFSAYRSQNWSKPNESIEDLMRGMGMCNLSEGMTNAYRSILRNIGPRYRDEGARMPDHYAILKVLAGR